MENLGTPLLNNNNNGSINNPGSTPFRREMDDNGKKKFEACVI